MENLLYVVLALLAGATAPVQAGINSHLRQSWAGDAVTASLVSFVVGTLALTAYLVAVRAPWPGLPVRVPWWQWTGGLFGAFFVTMTVLLSWRLGATAMFALVVAGQLVASLALDHWGLLGYPVRPLSWERLLGTALLVAGVVLIRRG
ncbi:DMT family transporter [Desulfocurvus sp.]|jgi:transporter family-2 protein|uniref:DMT family transporter n=1 Tax=Desulfocurvus sp. TaxID=2871698 RepID=UPI0025C62DC4|nr:DMT family transporter [Desulfocurvus sp.]MCK9241263.1 DMT family transporter [Desulfocurvus sp.]